MHILSKSEIPLMLIQYTFTGLSFILSCLLFSCANTGSKGTANTTVPETKQQLTKEPFKGPLVTHIFTADPSAHVFDGELYIYPSHDIISDTPMDNEGSHFDMKDYHVLSVEEIGDSAVDHGVALHIKDIPWAKRQLWAPDAAAKGGKYYLYFPAKDEQDIFAIGVAVSDSPTGPFKAEPTPITGTYSIDPSVFEGEGEYYMYFGGIWGGQLERWQTGEYKADGKEPTPDQPAIGPLVAKLGSDMKSLAETPREIQILDEEGNAIKAGDHKRRFFEAAWVHKYQGKYYFSYSTGDTHYIAYGVGDSPYGPFTYKGNVLEPVLGWTNHHSIVEYEGKWYLFYHDSKLSGQTHLRNVKMKELKHNADGTIETINAYK